MASSTRKIEHEQMRSQQLLVKLLPPTVAAKLKDQTVRFSTILPYVITAYLI